MADYSAIGAAELANFIPAITVDSANQSLGYLGKYLSMAKNVRKDFGTAFATRGDVLTVPKRGALSVNNKTAKFNVTVQAPSDDAVTVTLNKHKEVTFIIEDVAKAMAIPGTMEGYARDAAMVLAEAIEQDLVDLYASAGTTLAIGTYSADWVKALTAARRALVSNKVNKLAPVFAQLDPYAYEALLNNTNLTNAYAKGDKSAIEAGLANMVRGIQVDESQIVGIDATTSPDTYYDLVYGPDAIALCMRPLSDAGNGLGAQQTTVLDERTGLALRSTVSYDAMKLAVQVTLDCLYGVAIIRPEHVVAISHELGGNT